MKILENRPVDEVTYKSWVLNDRTTLETIVKPVEEFVDHLLINLNKLQKHDFIAKHQSMFLKQMKKPEMNYIIVIADLAENFSFVLQGAAQGFHGTNSQATIHPFVTYYSTQGQVKHKNCKNFLNLLVYKEDFGVPAEWHFFATSHGKEPYDGVGGTAKRLAACTSLQRPVDDQIQTPQQLYDWAKANFTNIAFSFVLTQQVEEEAMSQERFELACRVPGTQQFHSFAPSETPSHLLARPFSNSAEFSLVKVSSLPSTVELPWDEIHGYVTCLYDSKWWLAC